MTAVPAPEAYAVRRKQIETELSEIRRKLTLHRKRMKKNPSNWGLVGDIGHTLELLKEVNSSLPNLKV